MDDVTSLLSFDPLAAAENLTGKSYKEDDATSALGLLMHMEHGARKAEALKRGDDTHFGTTFADALRIYDELGFTEIHSREFAGRTTTERYVVMWRAGVLATVESYNATSLNTTKIYYNWRPNEDVDWWSYRASGHARDGVWVGDHDAREGLRNILSRLESAGEFLPVWVERPFLWLLSYADADADDYSYADVNASTIATFPADVVSAITPTVS